MSIRVGIVGVSGYGGGEALRLCANHPAFEVVYVAGESSAGARLVEKFPGIGKLGELTIKRWDPTTLPELDVLFASLPTGESKESLARVPARTRIVDIGGDHRYADGWTYGLADVWPERVRAATRIANPGCYPSAALLAVAPLVKAKLVSATAPVIIDAKSGVSGAGRKASLKTSFCEVTENFSAYSILDHRHVPEVLRTSGLSEGEFSFTAQLIPIHRGILETIYFKASGQIGSAEDLLEIYRSRYASEAAPEPFVRLYAPGHVPDLHAVAHTNFCDIGWKYDPETRRTVVVVAIDNLVKGAAGQAIQNMNLALGYPETAGLL
jgi:N-acetyl-gamma-glutamyl-phosphate reductase